MADTPRAVSSDAGQRTGTGDLVRIYLREIGRVPLLTAQDEVDLAKSIEAGLFAEEKLQGGFPLLDAHRAELGELAADGCGPSSGSSRRTCGSWCPSPSGTSAGAWSFST